VAEVATAYLYRSVRTLAEIASLIGRGSDTVEYRTLAEKVRDAWRAEFIDVDGTIQRATQANLARAITFGLVTVDESERVAAELVKRIREAGTTIGTGFLATPFLLPVLADHGHVDVAFDLLLQTRAPSWLNMIEAGSTTVWENWEGLDKNGQGSLNHYSKGAVITFLHQYVAGLRPIAGEPAYRRFEVRPVLGGGLRHARASLDSPYGPISVAWHMEGHVFELDVHVAPGTEAAVTLPDGSRTANGPGHHRFTVVIR
jgi:alpha-L-rhamnosidase